MKIRIDFTARNATHIQNQNIRLQTKERQKGMPKCHSLGGYEINTMKL